MLMALRPTPAREANKTTAVGFEQSITDALPAVETRRASRDYALDYGIDEKALERYASGACSLYERKSIESVLTRCRWAMSYVVALVKDRRPA